MNKVLFQPGSSQEWETPPALFAELDQQFHFTLDPCASDQNHKCKTYFTKRQDGLSRRWSGSVFMNPPYGFTIWRWAHKAYREACLGVLPIVCLVPARTDTKWWHDYCMRASRIMLIRGRLRFSGAPHNTPFPSAIVIYEHPPGGKPPQFSTYFQLPVDTG